jgi:hypothetical protein
MKTALRILAWAAVAASFMWWPTQSTIWWPTRASGFSAYAGGYVVGCPQPRA